MIHGFICPICRRQLVQIEKTLHCENGHCYDISKKGYVNLMMSQSSAKKRHGDDKLMIKARTDFLNLGLYAPLADAICEELHKYADDAHVIIDAGCGEGYYSERIHKSFPESDIYGIDISKDALYGAYKRDPSLMLCAASTSSIPLPDSCADIVTSIFAPIFPIEFARLLGDNGILITAVPLKHHLFGLKQLVYDNAYANPAPKTELDGFTLILRKDIEYEITLDNNESIRSLFMMTPYYYKTSRADQDKLSDVTRLTTQVGFAILIYKQAIPKLG